LIAERAAGHESAGLRRRSSRRLLGASGTNWP
jgi:hypothetical protein